MYLLPSYASVFVIGSFLALGRPVEGLPSTSLRQSSNDILKAIGHISQSLSELNTSVQSFGGTFDEAMMVYGNFRRIISSLEQGTTEVQNTSAPISDADASTIMSSALSFEPNLQSVLVTTVNKKDILPSLNVSDIFGIVEKGITEFNMTTCAFGNALIKIFSDSLKLPAITVRDKIIQQFNFAYERYAEQVPKVR